MPTILPPHEIKDRPCLDVVKLVSKKYQRWHGFHLLESHPSGFCLLGICPTSVNLRRSARLQSGKMYLTTTALTRQNFVCWEYVLPLSTWEDLQDSSQVKCTWLLLLWPVRILFAGNMSYLCQPKRTCKTPFMSNVLDYKYNCFDPSEIWLLEICPTSVDLRGGARLHSGKVYQTTSTVASTLFISFIPETQNRSY